MTLVYIVNQPMLAELAYKTQCDTQAHHQDDVFLLVRGFIDSFHASLACCRTKKIVPASNLGVSDRVAILSPNCMGGPYDQGRSDG